MKNLKRGLSMGVQALIVVAIAIAIALIVYGISNYVSTNNTVKVAVRSVLSMDKVVPSQDITELNRLGEKIKTNPNLDTTEEYRVSRFGIYGKTLQGTNVGSNINLISLLRNIGFSCVFNPVIIQNIQTRTKQVLKNQKVKVKMGENWVCAGTNLGLIMILCIKL